MAYRIVDGNIRTQHVHTLQQVLIETGQLRILESTTPIVSHQLIVCPDGEKPVSIDLMGMYGEKGLQCLDSLTETSAFQVVEDLIQ